MTTNRDPINPQVVAAAAKTWSDRMGFTFGKPTQDECDEADIALERVLLDQGVISPTDVIEYFTESDTGLGIAVGTAEGEGFIIWTDGTVS